MVTGEAAHAFDGDGNLSSLETKAGENVLLSLAYQIVIIGEIFFSMAVYDTYEYDDFEYNVLEGDARRKETLYICNNVDRKLINR